MLGWLLVVLGIAWTVLPTPFGVFVTAFGLGLAVMNSVASRKWLRQLVRRYPTLRHPLKRLPGIAGNMWLLEKERHLARLERKRLRDIAKSRERAIKHGGVKP